jgi:hypothetical protein
MEHYGPSGMNTREADFLTGWLIKFVSRYSRRLKKEDIEKSFVECPVKCRYKDLAQFGLDDLNIDLMYYTGFT